MSNESTRAEQGAKEHEIAAANRRVASAAGLDDSEAEVGSEPSEDGDGWGQEEFNVVEGEPEAAAHSSAPKRRRKVKTNPNDTGYTNRPMSKELSFESKSTKLK